MFPRPSPMLLGSKAATSTWNPADKSSNIALTNGNLTMTQVSATTAQSMARGMTSHSSGKYYFEVTINAYTSGQVDGVGLSTATGNLNSYVGTTGSIGYFSNGNVFQADSQIGTGPVFVKNSIIGIAVDLNASKIYLSVNGTYNSGVNPTTGVGGISFTGTTTLFIAASTNSNGDQYTLNTGGLSFGAAIPTGFVAWG